MTDAVQDAVLTANRVLKDLQKAIGGGFLAHSSVNTDLVGVLAAEDRVYDAVLEIGTMNGASAVVLACFARRVITLDVRRYDPFLQVMHALEPEIRKRIAPILIHDTIAKDILVRQLAVDMAFVDGNHKYPYAREDFSICTEAGIKLLLFHDYPESGNGEKGVGMMLDEVTEQGFGTVEPAPPCFAWWRAPE